MPRKQWRITRIEPLQYTDAVATVLDALAASGAVPTDDRDSADVAGNHRAGVGTGSDVTNDGGRRPCQEASAGDSQAAEALGLVGKASQGAAGLSPAPMTRVADGR